MASDLADVRLPAYHFESLVGEDEALRIVPLLAERWENVDDCTWLFHPRNGVKFHDGSDFTECDFLYTACRQTVPGLAPGPTGRLSRLLARDRPRARMVLNVGTAMNSGKTTSAIYANNPAKFRVVELSDGILQRETAMLLQNPWVRSRIHRLVFSAADVFGALGGIQVLRDRFGLAPDAISGRCSSSPLLVRELRDQSDIPVFNNARPDLGQLGEILL